MKNPSQIPNDQSKIFDINLIISIIILIIGLTFCGIFNPNISSQPFAIQLDAQRRIVGDIYIPKNTAAPYPVIILSHGVNSSKQYIAPWAMEMARGGIAAVTFDFHNFGESYRNPNSQESVENNEQNNILDAKAVLAFVRQHPERFDINRIGIGGHSMGGTIALALGQEDPKLRSTIILGIGGTANLKLPQNLLFAIGLYDQLNPVSELKERLYEATGRNLEAFQISGNFKAGDARMLAISATSDHLTAPYNPLLLKESVQWVEKSFDLPLSQLPIIVHWYIIGLLITFSGGIATSVCLLQWGNQNFRFSATPRLVSLTIIVSMLITWSLAVMGIVSTQWSSNILIFLYALQLVGNYTLKNPKYLIQKLKVISLYGVLFAIIFILPCLINGFPNIVKHPVYLLEFPQFIVYLILLVIYNCIQGLKTGLFSALSLELIPSYILGVLVLIELLFPSISLTLLERLSIHTVTALRQPIKISGIGNISRQTISFLGILIVVLVAILYQRIQSGVITYVSGRGLIALQIFFQMLLLPALIIIFGVRWSGFRKLENLCFQDRSL